MGSGFESTIGVTLIGLFFNTYLYGLVTYQFIVYHNTKYNDPFWIRAVVGTLFFLDTVHSAVCVYDAWDLCVINFANRDILQVVGWEIPFTAVATSVVAMISQGFLSYRLLRLADSWIMPSIIIVLSLIGGVGGIIAGIRSGIIWFVADFPVLKPNVIVWLGFQTAADILLTAALTMSFMRSRTGFYRTDSVLNRLIRGAVQTGLFTSIFALGDLFSFVFFGTTDLYAMFAFPIGRIYTNVSPPLLDTLNSRLALKDELSGVRDVDGTDASARVTGPNLAFGSNSQLKSRDGIPLQGISVTQETHSDFERKYDGHDVYDGRDIYAPDVV